MTPNESENQAITIGLHIGMPKTATTSLQLNFFSHHPDLAYVGQTNFRDNPDAHLILGYLSGVHAPKDHLFEEAIYRTLADKKTLMISDEALTMGQFMQRARDWSIQTEHRANAMRAKQLLGEAQVYMVIRNQAEWLQSWHRQGLKNGKYQQTALQDWIDLELKENTSQLFDLLNYERLYQAYADAFGAANVRVYLFEDYVADLGQLAYEMALGIDVEPRLAQVMMGHKARNLTASHFIQEGKSRPYPRYTREEKQQLMCHFEQTNQRLCQTLGINAEKLNYAGP